MSPTSPSLRASGSPRSTRTSSCLLSVKYADCNIISANNTSSITAGITPASSAPPTAPVTVAHSRTIATLRLVQPSRTKATLAPALVATTEIRLAPTATAIGICAAMIRAGTMKTPPPRPESAPTSPAPNDRVINPTRISSTDGSQCDDGGTRLGLERRPAGFACDEHYRVDENCFGLGEHASRLF